MSEKKHEEAKQEEPKKPTLKVGIEVPYDPENLRATLEEFESSVSTSDMKKMADHFKLESAPFHAKLLKPVLIGFVQNAWFFEVRGAVPLDPETNQKQRVKNYGNMLKQVLKGDSEDLLAGGIFVKKSKVTGEKAEKAGANVYRLTKAKEEVWGKFLGQKRLMVKAMLSLEAGIGGKGCTVKQISDTVRDTEETKAPSDKNCAFHINAWGHEGVVEKLGAEGKWGPAHEPKKDKEEAAEPEAEGEVSAKGKSKKK